MSHRLAAVPPAKQSGRVRSVLISGLAQAAKWNEALAFFQQMLGEIWV
jgi:pentatricopeptide repeat protein